MTNKLDFASKAATQTRRSGVMGRLYLVEAGRSRPDAIWPASSRGCLWR